MGDFGWQYINANTLISASGPTGSISFRVEDVGGKGAISGSDNLVYHTAAYLDYPASTLILTGNLEVSGALTAQQYNIDVVNKTVTNIESSGDTKFGDTPDDIHQFSGSVFISGSADITGSVRITGSLELTGSEQSLLVLNTQTTDTLKEIAFKKAGSTAAAIQINSNNHVFIENENAKDIILRTNNQNTLRVYGANQRVGINQVGPPSGTLDINGDTVITGSLTVSGSVTLGMHAPNAIIFVSGALTASKGIRLQEDSFIKSDKNLTFGNQQESTIQYNTAQDALIISGSQPGGIALSGSKLVLDHAGGTVVSGTLAGPGSYLGLSATSNTVVLAGVTAGGENKHIQFNKSNTFSGSANLQFDYDNNDLTLCGTMEVKSGSSSPVSNNPVVFEVDGTDGQIGGATRGKIAQVWSVNFDITSTSHATAGRFIGITQNSTAGESTNFTNVSSFLAPFSGRVTKLMFRFPGTYSNLVAARPVWILEVADIEQNGTSANSTTRVIHQATASAHPGQNVVGGIDFGSDTYQITGSWSFGTGSLVGLKSIVPGGVAFPGLAHLTLLVEFDQLDPYISGSGN